MTIVVTIDYYRYRHDVSRDNVQDGIAKILNDYFPNINRWQYDECYHLPIALEKFVLNVLLAVVEKKNKVYDADFIYISNNFCIILKEVCDG